MLTWGKSEVIKMVEAIDQDHPSAESAAMAALEAAEALFEKRAQYVVVGQLKANTERFEINPSDPDAIKLALGWFSTEGNALKAAESLSGGSGDTYRTWVLPMLHKSPAELSEAARAKYAESEAKRKEKARQKFHESIEKHRLAMEERAKGGRGSCADCGHEPWEHSMTGERNTRGKCRLTDCQKCNGWKEKR